MLYGAENVLETSQNKNKRNKFHSAAAKYIPSSLTEIQLGTELESAKYSKVSFNPDADYDSDGEKSPKSQKSSPSKSPSDDPDRSDDDRKSVARDSNVSVTDVELALVFRNTICYRREYST